MTLFPGFRICWSFSFGRVFTLNSSLCVYLYLLMSFETFPSAQTASVCASCYAINKYMASFRVNNILIFWCHWHFSLRAGCSSLCFTLYNQINNGRIQSEKPRKLGQNVFLYVTLIIWTASSEFGTYSLCEQRRFRRACASAQSRQNLRCSLIQVVNQEKPSDRKPDPWLLWMAGHAQLKIVMTGCSKTQIRLMRLIL